MSLITDLLSKAKKQKPRMDIPPILKDEIAQTNVERRMRRRVMIALILALVLVASGFGAIYFVESMKEPSLLGRTRPTVTAPSQSTHKANEQTPSPQGYAGMSEHSPGDRMVREQTMAPEKQKDSLKPLHEKVIRRFASKKTPGVQKPIQEARQEEAGAGELKDWAKTSGSITRKDRDINLYAARTYEMQKNYHEALVHYKKVLAMEPNNYVVMNNIASMLIHLGFCEEAVRHAQKALNLRRGYVFSMINLGIGLGCLGKYSESESYLRKSLMTEPSNHYALLNLALLYEKQSSFEMANRYFAKLSERGNIHGYLGLARIAERQNRVDDAIRFYRTAISRESVDPHTSQMVNERLMQLSR